MDAFISCYHRIAPFQLAGPVRATQQGDAAQSSDDTAMEGTVVSASRQTLVLRLDDNRFQLFTYERPSVPPVSLAQGTSRSGHCRRGR